MTQTKSATDAIETGSTARALAVGAFALGAAAIGAIAVGAVAIGRLRILEARIEKLSIGTLTVDHLDVPPDKPLLACRSVIHPTRIDGKCGDHFLQADFPLPIAISQ